jgi:hypothetical protein
MIDDVNAFSPSVSFRVPGGKEKIYKFYSVRARELLMTIWRQIQMLMNKRDSTGETTPCTIRSRANTHSTAGSEFSSRAGTPTRQSAFPGGVPPEELRKRMVEHQSWGHGYDKLVRTFITRQVSEGGFEIPDSKELIFYGIGEVEEEEDPYSHIGDSDDDVDGSAEDDSYENRFMVLSAHNSILDGPRDDPPPSPRCSLRLDKDKGRTTSDSSKASSRDSGILSPTEPRPNIVEEIQDRHDDWRHHDSVDSAYSSSTRRGSNEPVSLTDLEEQYTDRTSIELLKESIDAYRDGPISPLVQQLSSSMDALHLNSAQDEENIYEELSKQRCSYRKNLFTFLGAEANSLESLGIIPVDCQATKEGTTQGRKNTELTAKICSKKVQKVKLTREHKMAEIRTVLKAMGKSDDEENIYEDMDTFLKKKDLSKIFGDEFVTSREGITTPESPIRPKDVKLQRSVSQFDPEKPRRFKRFRSIVKRLKSPLGGKIGEVNSGSDEPEDDPQRDANRTLQHLESWLVGESSDNLLYESTPPLPKPRASSASVTVIGSPKDARERKRSKSHPNDFYVNAAGLLPEATETPDEHVYDVPRNNNSVESADDENEADDTNDHVTPQTDVIDLISRDNDYEDVTEPLSPFQPFKNDPFDIAWELSTKEQIHGLTEKNRVHSEPDFRQRYPDQGHRAAMSMPSEALCIPPPLPPSRVTMYVESDSVTYKRTTSYELNNSNLARPLSIGDSGECCSHPVFNVGSPDNSPLGNLEYIQSHRKSFLSDISESERSRQGSFSFFQHDDANRDSAMEISTSWIGASHIDSNWVPTNGYSSDESSDYVDMSGLPFKTSRSGTDSTYVSMSGSYK